MGVIKTHLVAFCGDTQFNPFLTLLFSCFQFWKGDRQQIWAFRVFECRISPLFKPHTHTPVQYAEKSQNHLLRQVTAAKLWLDSCCLGAGFSERIRDGSLTLFKKETKALLTCYTAIFVNIAVFVVDSLIHLFSVASCNNLFSSGEAVIWFSRKSPLDPQEQLSLDFP